MSKRIEAKIVCPNCSNQFDFSLYRSIWGEYPENRELVMSDKINVATCPFCNQEIKLEFPFMYTNAKQCFAVWWEPVFDPQIDSDSQAYVKMMGVGNYLATAPRIKKWEDFKNTILKFEKGEMKGGAVTINKEMNDQMQGLLKNLKNQNKKNNGNCLGVAVILITSCFSLLCEIIQMIF